MAGDQTNHQHLAEFRFRSQTEEETSFRHRRALQMKADRSLGLTGEKGHFVGPALFRKFVHRPALQRSDK